MGKMKMIIAIASLCIAALIIWQMTKTLTTAEPLSEIEASKIVQEMYNGVIVEIKKESNLYKIKMELETGIYLIDIDRQSGDIAKLTRVEVAQAKPSNDEKEVPTKDKPKDDTPHPPKEEPKSPNSKITQEEAIEIALTRVNGVVDDVDMGQSGGKSYYLIEIENAEGVEAKIQINAITGEVMNIIWDD